MYHGEVSVQEEELPALLKIAEALKVKGLVESDDKEGKQSPSSIGPNVTSSNIQKPSSTSKLPIWPVSTNKLLSPKAKSESGYSNHGNPTDEDPGTLIIDEESNEGGNITMVSAHKAVINQSLTIDLAYTFVQLSILFMF